MSASHRILVADDNTTNQAVIRGMLEHAGFEVDSVKNGEEAIHALESQNYDLVIMDCLMPVLDGFAATRRIRGSVSAQFDPQIPILATTALTSERDRQKCLDSGMTAFITKPIDAGSLFAAINHCLAGSADSGTPDRRQAGEPIETPAPAELDENQSHLLKSMFHLFSADAALWQKDLKSLAEALKLVELGQLAHKIRGSADVFSEPGLSELAQQLELSCKLEQKEPSLRLTALLVEELRCLERKYKSAD